MTDKSAYAKGLYDDMINGLRLGSSCLSELANPKNGDLIRLLLYLPNRPMNATATFKELWEYRIANDLCFSAIDIENGVVVKKKRSLDDEGIIELLSKQLDNYLSDFPEKDRKRFQNYKGRYTKFLLGAINGIGHKVINTHKQWTKYDHSPETMLLILRRMIERAKAKKNSDCVDYKMATEVFKEVQAEIAAKKLIGETTNANKKNWLRHKRN